MPTYIDLLPNELQQHIYEKYFKKHCLVELKSNINKIQNTQCQECYIKGRFIDTMILNYCIKCNRIMCNSCKKSSYKFNVRTPEYKGWCNTCIWMEIG